MPNLLTEDLAIVGDLTTLAGHVAKELYGTITRVMTSPTPLFTLPAGALPLESFILAGPSANPRTSGSTLASATVRLGLQSGSGVELGQWIVFDFYGAAPNDAGRGSPTIAASPTAQVVVGQYAESGAASTQGGPWVVGVRFLTF